MYRIRLVLLTGLLLLLAGCAVNPVTGRQELALMSVSPAEEAAMGQQAYPQVIQQMDGVYPDPALEAYVNRVGKRLGKVSHRPELNYTFRVINNSVPNAFALPGGYIAITRGLLVALDNEAQLAAVLGHEIVHVTARHSVQSMQRQRLMGLGVGLLGAAVGDHYGPLSKKAGQLAAGLLENSYSREQESEADRIGIDYMVRAGYDPRGAIALQEYFYRQVEKGADPNWVEGLFRTHPFSKERLDANRAYVASRYPTVRGILGEPQFHAAVAGLKRTAPAYALYDQAKTLEKQGQTMQAIETYQKATLLAPEQALIQAGLGLAYLRTEDLVPARRYLERAVQLDGNYYQSRNALGYLLLQKKEYPEAVVQLEKGMDLLPTTQGGFLLAEAYAQTGRRAEAVRLYQAVGQADSGRLGQLARQRAQDLLR